LRRLHKILYISLGLICVGFGMLGAVLPVLPTTPFLLVALWLFARSSERFHRWLYHHPVFGKTLQNWEQHQVITTPVKVIAVTSMFASMTYVIMFKQPPYYAAVPLVILISLTAWYILSKPGKLPEVTEQGSDSGPLDN